MRCLNCSGFLHLDGVDSKGRYIYTCSNVINFRSKNGTTASYTCGAARDLQTGERVLTANIVKKDVFYAPRFVK